MPNMSYEAALIISVYVSPYTRSNIFILLGIRLMLILFVYHFILFIYVVL